jgi:threonyl-tRNA synthetase
MSVHLQITDEDRKYPSIIEWLEAAHPGVAAQAVAARWGGRLLDLTRPLPDAQAIEIVTFDDEEGREVYRHTASHVMAQAVKRLVPRVKLAIGPAIADGFYYDFDSPESFSPEFLEQVEAEMAKIVAAGYPTERTEMPRAEALQFYRDRGEDYKVELLEGIPEGETVSFYRQDDFIDLCRGPHLPTTGGLGAFKLLSVAGAYWRGDEHRPMLQRIYGTAFPTQEMLDEHLRMRQQAAQRDHRKLGRELDLFSIQEAVGPGLPLWHPKGALIRELIEDFWRREHRRRGYDIVVTPHIGKESLWVQSGHLEHFAEGMYGPMEIEEERYRIKPMNCPFHLLIYRSQVHSYRDLPIRMAELGTVYRYERSGVLEGLLRVRCFTQDDAHIFCTPEQMPAEIAGVLDFALYMMHTFGYQDLMMELAVRGDDRERYLGDDADWESAERVLAEAMQARGLEYKVGVGEAKFYGPAIDIKLKDCMGKQWQGPTIQFDFNEPKRFGVTYVGEDGQHHHCLMIHRVVLGAMERFIAGLVEHYGGAFPLWLSPVQVVVIPITDRQHDYAREVQAALVAAGVRVQVDDRHESMRLKIREAQLQKVPYMLVVGDREVEQRSVAVRDRAEGDLGSKGLEEFVESVEREARPPDLRH